MNKKLNFKKVISMILILVLVITSNTIISFAKDPTIDTKPQKQLKVGSTNQLKYQKYNCLNNTLLGVFTVPETGKYTFCVTNNGDEWIGVKLLDSNLSCMEYELSIENNKSFNFKTYSLKKNENIYFYIEDDIHSYRHLLAANVNIKKIQESKPKSVISLNKSTISLKKNQKATLKLKNNKKKVTWVSSNNKIATVSSKGVVTAKKAGTAYIYAIANNKLYICKAKVNK